MVSPKLNVVQLLKNLTLATMDTINDQRFLEIRRHVNDHKKNNNYQQRHRAHALGDRLKRRIIRIANLIQHTTEYNFGYYL